jgi:hypothetical protein
MATSAALGPQEVKQKQNASKLTNIAEKKEFFLFESIVFFSHIFWWFNLSGLRIEKQTAQFRTTIGANSFLATLTYANISC